MCDLVYQDGTVVNTDTETGFIIPMPENTSSENTNTIGIII
jgi:hypothetical protein